MGNDRGQVTALMILAVALAALLLLAAGQLGRAASDRAQARTAADAAALAGAAEGEEMAEQLAEANGGRLESYAIEDGEVVVKVSVDGVHAYSRARAVRAGGVGNGVAPRDPGGLAPAMAAAVARAEGMLGQPIPVASGYRSPQEQQALWDNRHNNPYPVARPGSSMHERGFAIDVPSGFVDQLLTVASAAGLCQPLPVSDPIHFELCGVR